MEYSEVGLVLFTDKILWIVFQSLYSKEMTVVWSYWPTQDSIEVMAVSMIHFDTN